MNRFWMRRGALLFLLTVTVAVLVGLISVRRTSLQHASYFSGYLLFAAVTFLASLNVRKRLNFVPLGSASGWLQAHIYVGIGAIVLFLAHTGWRMPSGYFEVALYVLFALTSISGLVGLYLTRSIPRRLTKLREEFIYERIPALRIKVQQSAQALIVDLVRTAPAEALVDLYLSRLVDYFVCPRGFLYYVAPSGRLRNRLQHQLRGITRFLAANEREAQSKLSRLIDRRDDLDYHHAQQRRLKLWLFVHLGLTVLLLIAMSIHAVVVHAFGGHN